MAIHDLLWACPLCGIEGGLKPEGKGVERCHGCGSRFRRDRGDRIVAEYPGRGREVRPAGEWAAALPELSVFPEETPQRKARVRARFARRSDRAIRAGEEVVGFMERLADPVPGELVLEPELLRFCPDVGPERVWPLGRVTAIQPSSSTVQVKSRGEPVVSFRFPEASARFWEELLQGALRRFYRERGWGEIREFQPRIVTG